MLAKTGPRMNSIARRPVARSSSMISVPVMSAGIRSGVNWMRLKERSSTEAMVRTSSVFARPGTPVMMECPPTKSESSTSSTTSSCPLMALRISPIKLSRAAESRPSSSSSRSTFVSTAMRPPLLSRDRQQKLLSLLVTRRDFERAQHGALGVRRPAERVQGARDVVVGLGHVRGPERERRLELRERARRVLRLKVQLAGARVRRRLERRDVEAEAHRFERAGVIALFEAQVGEPAERLQVRLVVPQERLQ